MIKRMSSILAEKIRKQRNHPHLRICNPCKPLTPCVDLKILVKILISHVTTRKRIVNEMSTKTALRYAYLTKS